jgi:hypothetical protein
MSYLSNAQHLVPPSLGACLNIRPQKMKEEDANPIESKGHATPSKPASFFSLTLQSAMFFHFCCPLRRQRDTHQSKAVGRSCSFLFLHLFFISQYSLAPMSLRSIAQVHLHSLSNATLANLDGNRAAHQNISTAENTRIDVGHSPTSGTNLGAHSQDGSSGTLSQGRCFFLFFVFFRLLLLHAASASKYIASWGLLADMFVSYYR